MASSLSQDDLNVLKRTAMFSSLDDSALTLLLAGCPVLHRPCGSHVFRAGEVAERFFVILTGQVKIFKLSPKGDEQILHLYGPGETFAEAAVLGRINYPAFADTLKDTTLLEIRRKTLREAIANNPDLAMGMLGGLVSKLREFNLLIEQLSLKEVPARLGGVLLSEAVKAGGDRITLKHSKRQLAFQIGTTPETLSRALGKLKASGIITVRGSSITILNRDALADLAEGE